MNDRCRCGEYNALVEAYHNLEESVQEHEAAVLLMTSEKEAMRAERDEAKRLQATFERFAGSRMEITLLSVAEKGACFQLWTLRKSGANSLFPFHFWRVKGPIPMTGRVFSVFALECACKHHLLRRP